MLLQLRVLAVPMVCGTWLCLNRRLLRPKRVLAENLRMRICRKSRRHICFYICRNHPFIDGNKRAALGACLVFLRLNEIEPEKDGPEWEQLTLDVASSALDRDETTARLRTLLEVRK